MTISTKKLSAEEAVTIENLSYSDLMMFEDNDFGNAQRFLKFASGKALYDSASSNWFLFDAGRWKPDNERKERVRKQADGLYKFMLKGLTEEYQYLEAYGFDLLKGSARDIVTKDVNEDDLTDIYAQVKQCMRDRQTVIKLGNGSIQRRLIESAEAQLVDETVKLNPYNHLLVVANGTVDLKTGKLQDHNRTHYSTMKANVAYNRKAKKPTRFLKFLDEIFTGNVSMINYIQRVLGYCLTGETREHQFYILYGNGGNGKGVLINLIRDIMGEYYAEVSDGALARRADGDKPNSTLVQAKNCRILVNNESAKNAKLNDSLIKQISAGDEICPRALRKDNKHFIPHMKILWVTNHIPKLDWSDGGMERRIRLIPFTVHIPEEDKEVDLSKILWEEREGVLKWLVDGAVSYYKEGMADIPEVMQEAMDRERFGADSILRFHKKEVISTGDNANQYKSHAIYTTYSKICIEKWNVLPKSETMFGRRFSELCKSTSIQKKKHQDGYYFHGLRLLSGDADSDVTAEA